MPSPPPNNASLFSPAMLAVLAAQFLSAAADNALLFAAIGLIKANGFPLYFSSMLQEFFAGAFILLAPFVGPFADAYPKGRVMLVANTIKFFGACAMLFGLHPLLAYGIVGLGAAAYSPAKYGILRELISDSHPPNSAPNKIATMVEPSIKPLALTNLSADTNSRRMPYLAGE